MDGSARHQQNLAIQRPFTLRGPNVQTLQFSLQRCKFFFPPEPQKPKPFQLWLSFGKAWSPIFSAAASSPSKTLLAVASRLPRARGSVAARHLDGPKPRRRPTAQSGIPLLAALLEAVHAAPWPRPLFLFLKRTIAFGREGGRGGGGGANFKWKVLRRMTRSCGKLQGLPCSLAILLGSPRTFLYQGSDMDRNQLYLADMFRTQTGLGVMFDAFQMARLTLGEVGDVLR